MTGAVIPGEKSLGNASHIVLEYFNYTDIIIRLLSTWAIKALNFLGVQQLNTFAVLCHRAATQAFSYTHLSSSYLETG